MAITHHFTDSRDRYDYGYYAYIEDNQLVIGEDWHREGGETYRGTYADAAKRLEKLKQEDECLYYNIKAYFANPKHREEVDKIQLPANVITAKEARVKGDKVREEKRNAWIQLFKMINENSDSSTIVYDEHERRAYFKEDRKRVKQELEKLGYTVEYSRAVHECNYGACGVEYHNKYKVSW
jgi:hypothetical protein